MGGKGMPIYDLGRVVGPQGPKGDKGDTGDPQTVTLTTDWNEAVEAGYYYSMNLSDLNYPQMGDSIYSGYVDTFPGYVRQTVCGLITNRYMTRFKNTEGGYWSNWEDVSENKASGIAFTPKPSLTANNVQAAIEEVNNKLMNVGTATWITDWNEAVEPGFYSSACNATNIPVEKNQQNYIGQVIKYPDNNASLNIKQIAYTADGNACLTRKRTSNGIWSEWKYINPQSFSIEGNADSIGYRCFAQINMHGIGHDAVMTFSINKSTRTGVGYGILTCKISYSSVGNNEVIWNVNNGMEDVDIVLIPNDSIDLIVRLYLKVSSEYATYNVLLLNNMCNRVDGYQDIENRITYYPGDTGEFLTEAQVEESAHVVHSTDSADKIKLQNTYTKEESHQAFANAFVGEKSGEIVGLSDVCENTVFRRAAVQGVTTEALVNPEADKSPDNIATISGAEPTKLTTCGKNLITFTPATTSRYGLTCVRKADGTITLDGTWVEDNPDNTSTDFTIMANASFKPGTYFLSGCPTGGSYNTYRIYMRTEGPNSNVGYYNEYGTGCSVTINEGDVAQIWVRVIDQIGTVHLTFRPQLEVATSATPFEPYTGVDYTLPAMEPLMSLPNGVCDEYDTVSGVETRRIGKLTLNGTENWNILSEQCNESSSFFYLNFSMGGSIVDCTHLICRPVVSGSISYTDDGIYGNAVGGSLYIRLNNSHNITTAEGLKSWLAAQETAGTPVTVYYELQTSTTTQHDPEEIPVIYPTTTVFADDGKVSVSYNRDSNKVIEQITLDYIEQITALDARIAQLEIGG